MQVEDIKTLTIDGEQYEVDSMSDIVKQMVAVFNDWNRDEAHQRQKLMKTQAAKNDMSRQIIMQVRKEQKEAEEAAATPQEETTPTVEA